MNKFRLLRANEIECRISSISEKGLSLLLYKTARTDANLLDETVGAENWENDFKVVDGVLYGGIGISDDVCTTWKWDAGTESNTEAEKGRASDAFKRAGFKWGIGRELYTSPFIWIPSSNCEIKEKEINGKKRLYCNDTFRVVEIEYNKNSEISKLIIANDAKGIDVFSYPRFARNAAKNESNGSEVKVSSQDKKISQKSLKEPIEAPDGYYYCESCGNEITEFNSKGKKISQREFAANTLSRYGKQLCKECATKAKNEVQTG